VCCGVSPRSSVLLCMFASPCALLRRVALVLSLPLLLAVTVTHRKLSPLVSSLRRGCARDSLSHTHALALPSVVFGQQKLSFLIAGPLTMSRSRTSRSRFVFGPVCGYSASRACLSYQFGHQHRYRSLLPAVACSLPPSWVSLVSPLLACLLAKTRLTHSSSFYVVCALLSFIRPCSGDAWVLFMGSLHGLSSYRVSLSLSLSLRFPSPHGVYRTTWP
jgi:hypothetical protein